MDDDRLQAYANQASSIDIGTITSGANVEVLQRLRGNDPGLTKLAVCGEVYRGRVGSGSGFEHYCPSDNEDLGWVGAFIGYNNDLRELIVVNPIPEENDSLPKFLAGVSRNRSIQRIKLVGVDGDILRELEPFFENNANLRYVMILACDFRGEGGDRQIASIIRGCRSLNLLHLQRNLDGDERPTSIVAALNTHTKLKYLHLRDMNVGSNGCRSLAALPCFSNLRQLNLLGNSVDDDGVEGLMRALASGNRLRYLNLAHNPAITTRGLQSIAGTLESPTTNLEKLDLLWNGVDDDGADILAPALLNNDKFEVLGLVADSENRNLATHMDITASDNLITARGWQAFADVLCNTSSIEATCRSNHTLNSFSRTTNNLPSIRDEGGGGGATILSSLTFLLKMNQRGVRDASRGKIIRSHLGSDAGMCHFAGMDRAVLPRALAWVPDDELSLLYRVARNLQSELVVVPS